LPVAEISNRRSHQLELARKGLASSIWAAIERYGFAELSVSHVAEVIASGVTKPEDLEHIESGQLPMRLWRELQQFSESHGLRCVDGQRSVMFYRKVRA
jgi:hypothetical protein